MNIDSNNIAESGRWMPARAATDDADERLRLRLRAAVRQGSDPDNPPLLLHWLDVERAAVSSAGLGAQWASLREQYRLLLDAYSDLLVPAQWRQLCLDNIHRPLQSLRWLVRDDSQRRELAQLEHELRVIAHFFRAV